MVNLYLKKIFLLFISIIFFQKLIWAQSKIEYELSMPEPHTHYFEVIIKLNNLSKKSIDLKMPVWAPGSYLVREFSKNVDSFEAKTTDGDPLTFNKTSKNTWHIENPSQKNILVKYTVYANELSVRTSFINSDFGFVSGTGIFMYLDKMLQLPCSVKVNPYKEWKKVTTNLTATGNNIFIAENYDELADSPIQIGNHETFDFTASGVTHTVAMVGTGNYNIDSLKKDMARVVENCTSVIGENPNKHYTFIVHNLTIPSGGLEHKGSTTLQVNRFTYQPRADYLKFLTLVAHEYFHLWNVKRIRPIALGPFDYENENYTNLLFISEGFTSYYEELLMVKAGYKTPKEYVEYMAGTIGSTEVAPGNKVQSLSESSFDAWIKGYRPNENSRNVTISYYGKGEVIGALLDLSIINTTKGKKNLDDLMRYLYKTYYQEKKRGFTDEEFKAAAETIAETKLDELFKSIYTTQTPNYQKYLDYVGVKLVILTPDISKSLLGASFQENAGKLIVKGVQRGTSAYDNGLNVDDEIIAVDGFRVNQDKFSKYLQNIATNTKIKLLISRDDIIKELTIELKPNNSPKYFLVDDADKTPEQLNYFNKWMRR